MERMGVVLGRWVVFAYWVGVCGSKGPREEEAAGNYHLGARGDREGGAVGCLERFGRADWSPFWCDIHNVGGGWPKGGE